jgi:hypothetical protein
MKLSQFGTLALFPQIKTLRSHNHSKYSYIPFEVARIIIAG